MTDESGIGYAAPHHHPARQRAGRARLLRRHHREHAHRQREPPGAADDRQRRAGARRAGGVGAPDADVARRPERARPSRTWPGTAPSSRSRSPPAPGANGLQALLPTAGPEGSLETPDPRRQPRRVPDPDDQGDRVRRLHGRGRHLQRHLRRRRRRAGDHRRAGGSRGSRRGDGHLDDRRARDLARRLRRPRPAPSAAPRRT